MEAALLSGFIKAILPRLFSLVDNKHKLHKGVKGDINFLIKELRMIVGTIDDELTMDHGAAAVPQLSVDELRELAHGIEDCIDGVLYRTAREQQHSSSLIRRTVRVPKKVQTNLQLAQELQRLKRVAEEANQRKQRYGTVPGHHGQPSPSAASSSYASDPRIHEADLVGVDADRAVLLEQLAERQPEQLKVIAIVGFCGLGKTALAAEAYNREIGCGRFERHAWVCAAHWNVREMLGELFRKLDADGRSCHGASDPGQLCVDIRQQLEKKRYFVVIDDIQTEDQWKAIKIVFPVDKDIGSRILVTTTIQSVANACCSANGYLHKMSRLDKNCSKQLFSRKACPEKYSHYKQPDSAAILKKCDGQPLALVTIGEFLQANGWPTGPNCEDVCNRLHYHLENDKTFERMRHVLIRNYTSLPGHALKACLLYFGMFPCDHPIRRKSLLRRWSAEGFVEPLSSSSNLDSAAAFDVLMDRNIIEPINVSNNDKVKTCQTYGMMHEFILHMSISQNFVTLFCDEKFLPKYVRRLSLHGNTAVDADNFDVDLSLIRSLSIFGEAGKTVLDFSKYQLLRVLDLEKCDDLKDDHLKEICNLVLLKYLSLGGNITKLPKDIAKLKDLEVLDVRRTKIKIMPVEVFQLPCLIHLLGKFKLSDKVKQKTEVQEFLLKGKSNLETLAGFASNGSEGFLHLMSYMNKLRKLKIWCKSSAPSTSWTDLREAIQKFIMDDKEANIGTRSLSLHVTECSEDILNSLKKPCYLSSLKLHGNFSRLPQFVTSLRGLKELCLSSTKFTTGLLEALSNLSYLQYLKLIADELEKFIIKDQGFPRLLHLCIVLEFPTFPVVEEGALPFLVTLKLLCKDLHGLSDIKIECFKHLQEVTLDSRVTPVTRLEWVRAAKEHSNRPKVLFLNSTGESALTDDYSVTQPTKSETPENSTAPEGLEPKTYMNDEMQLGQGLESSFLLSKQNNFADQSSSKDQLHNSFDNMGLSDVSPAVSELRNGMMSSCTCHGSRTFV